MRIYGDVNWMRKSFGYFVKMVEDFGDNNFCVVMKRLVFN